MQNLTLFFFATLALAITPGQDFIYVMIRSVSQGTKAGITAIAGLMVGVMFHTIFAATGIAAILLTSSYAFLVIKLIGASYLIYLGVQAFRQTGKLEIKEAKNKISSIRLFREGVLSSLFNPKLALFFMAFLPQFVSDKSHVFTHMLTLGILFALISLPILIAVAVLSANFGNIIISNKKVSQKIGQLTGVVLIGLGLRLAFTER